MNTIDDKSVEDALTALTQQGRKHDHGFFEFPFGRIKYVDSSTLRIEYHEIFRDGIYDFTTGIDRPFIVDCGANIGLSVIRAKVCYPSCSILTFEADPTIFAALQSNISELRLTDIRAECVAVSTVNGTARFYVEGGEGGRLSEDGQIVVPTISISDRLDRNVDLLKVDIEGAEWDVMMDIIRTGAIRNVRHLIVEFHGWKHKVSILGAIITGLAENGFSMTFPWSFCEPGLAGPQEKTPFRYARDGKFILFLHAWR